MEKKYKATKKHPVLKKGTILSNRCDSAYYYVEGGAMSFPHYQVKYWIEDGWIKLIG